MAELGFAERFTPHDLRRSLASGMGELGVSQEVVGLVISHDKKGTTGRVYDLSERLTERAEALRRSREKTRVAREKVTHLMPDPTTPPPWPEAA
jgi:integrase